MKSDLNQDIGLQRVIPGLGSFVSTLTASLGTAGAGTSWLQTVEEKRRHHTWKTIIARREPADKTGAKGHDCVAKQTNQERQNTIKAQWAWLERPLSGIACSL